MTRQRRIAMYRSRRQRDCISWIRPATFDCGLSYIRGKLVKKHSENIKRTEPKHTRCTFSFEETAIESRELLRAKSTCLGWTRPRTCSCWEPMHSAATFSHELYTVDRFHFWRACLLPQSH